MKGKLSLWIFVCLFSVGAAFGQRVLRLDEATTKAFIKSGTLETKLVFENKSKPFAANVRLEILDANNNVLTQSAVQENIRRGRQNVSLALPFSYDVNSNDYLWYRLRYTISAIDQPEKTSASGIVSLSEITPDIFELRAAASDQIYAGMNYRVRVRAFQPVTSRPMPQVKIKGAVEIELDTDADADEIKLNASGVTDQNGFAVLDFKIPNNAKIDDGDVKITGEKNGIEREAENDLDASNAASEVYLNTDKPIYQPGQKLSVRGLFLSRGITESNTKALPNQELEFVVKDEDDAVLYRETVKTSRFGIAAINWQIPENAKLGTYSVEVEADDDLDRNQIRFKVSRYDLPNFTVSVKPNKTFYLPDENTAEITVGADYLFGKPVSSGAVKIVRETSRRWNYQKQKMETDEEESYTGETNADGKYTAKIDLTKAHVALKEAEYRKFEDVGFAAYFTDRTTNRTEQKRFDLRVTKDAIHVYIVGIESYDDQNPALPIKFYVSTDYADGTPAACDVLIEGKYEDEEKLQQITSVKTNALGAGRVEFSAPKRADEIYVDDLQIKVSATDTSGKKGSEEEEISIDEDEKTIQISTDKAIYKTGEPVKIEIASTEKTADVFIDIARNFSSIESKIVRLKDGRATLKVPYNAEFINDLTVAATIDDDGDEIEASRGIAFPRPTNLRFNAALAQTTYRPNEEATINFAVTSADKKSADETALGVVIFDKAIEERAATDADFGNSAISQFGGYSDLLDSRLTALDLSKPLSADWQLKAEMILANAGFNLRFFESNEYKTNLKSVFADYFKRQFDPIEDALKYQYATDFTHPTNENLLQKMLLEQQIDFASLRDPWGNSYKPIFSVERDDDVLRIVTAGANKKFGDADDFTILELRFKYFTPVGRAIDKANAEFYQLNGKFIRDFETLKNELRKQNIDLETLRDRWNRPYRISFGASGRFYSIDFTSGGDDDDDKDYEYNDFVIWSNRADYFADTETRIQTILSNYANEQKTFPKTEAEFKEILKRAAVDFDQLHDGWNRPLQLTFETYSRYADKIKVESITEYQSETKQKTTLVPVTQQIAIFRMISAGEDGEFGDYKDSTLATFSGVISEQSKTDAKPIQLKTETVFTGGKGAVRGAIIDPNGAVVAGAKAKATNNESNAEFEATADENGVYLLKNLPSGKYRVQIESPGFAISVVENVPVRSSNVTELDLMLNVAGASTEVTVTGEAAVINQTQSSVSTVITQSQIEQLPINGRSLSQSYVKNKNKSGKSNENVATVLEESSTPRLREYFPETLVWQPELVTDKNGKAELKFKLGDNITTWKMYAIASNAEGKIGVTAQEIQAFQPFFVDLEPPKFLTVSDEIALPAQIRNYTETKQKVAVEMAKSDWFDFIKPANQQIEVEPNQTQNAVFDFRASRIIKNGKQRVIALAGKDSDAIEKPVTVRPDGKEIVQTESRIFRDAATFDVNFPNGTLPNTQRAELKIYPNLLAHVAESIEGLLQRPYGCGEQTVSSTYPNLMVLKFTSKNSKIHATAEEYLRKGYERLLGYQNANGGFAVWTQDQPDVALTAYALRFLVDAEEFIDVDEDVMKRARTWLIDQQRTDGSWTRIYSWEKNEDAERTKLITTYTARTLAMIEKSSKEKDKDSQAVLQRGLDYLKARNHEIDEPYALALFGLASLDAGNLNDAKQIAQKLETMAIQESDRVYWNLETNTPFYGWGTAGRIETTALAVQLLQKVLNEESKTKDQKLKTEDLISKGTQFLLKNKDRYGVWYSTQTTINVLDAFLALINNSAASGETRAAEIFVNNQKVKDVVLPPENQLSFPLNFDLPLGANANSVEIKIAGSKSATMAQIVQTHYVGWQNYIADGRSENQSRALRLAYDCDKKTARPAEEITCQVEAERVGFKGYGMLLAEIGLPPGAEVDRASLEKAKTDNWNFSRYDILPDRIIVYLWAQAGGTKFDFKFKPRYGINAQTAASVVYDYYNPEAQATLPPLKFSVK